MDQEVWKLIDVIDWTMSERDLQYYTYFNAKTRMREKGYHRSPTFIGHSVITRISDTNMVWNN